MERLQKIIAQSTDYSRRAAEKLITEGKVSLNGRIVTELGTKAELTDEILVEGNVITQHDHVYYLLNKPIRVISSRSDEKGRTVITDLIDERQKVYPVGRLDYFTTGLILVTNDGNLANGLMHPRYNIPKTYRAKVEGRVTDYTLKDLAKGVKIEGYKTKPAKVRRVRYTEKTDSTVVEITISEGKNNQVRKMFETVGHPVETLKRTKYAFFDLETETLPAGASRPLSVKEIRKLYNLIGEAGRE
ncbi:pseudouridine synthase [Mollicutes bacterium LVI A0078]|nr:pseudouridine synthase [Mollicutes bacterium LVI A0075]WOO90762.1 pseudouridine synthase [Mollicutes bacterium LVI A0078]